MIQKDILLTAPVPKEVVDLIRKNAFRLHGVGVKDKVADRVLGDMMTIARISCLTGANMILDLYRSEGV